MAKLTKPVRQGRFVAQLDGNACGSGEQFGVARAVVADRVVLRCGDERRRKAGQVGGVGGGQRGRQPSRFGLTSVPGTYQCRNAPTTSRSRIGPSAFSVIDGSVMSPVVEDTAVGRPTAARRYLAPAASSPPRCCHPPSRLRQRYAPGRRRVRQHARRPSAMWPTSRRRPAGMGAPVRAGNPPIPRWPRLRQRALAPLGSGCPGRRSTIRPRGRTPPPAGRRAGRSAASRCGTGMSVMSPQPIVRSSIRMSGRTSGGA